MNWHFTCQCTDKLCFYGHVLWGFYGGGDIYSDIIILYCTNSTLPDRKPTPKYNPHRKLSAFLHFQKTYDLSCFHHGEQKSTSNISGYTILVETFGFFLDHTHTHTHTHTHVGFYGLRGLSIGVMVFILYKLYVLLPYTYPTPKLSPHRRRCISTFPPKNAHCMIYKHFEFWGHWKCPHKSPSPCNTCVIPMSLYKFVSS